MGDDCRAFDSLASARLASGLAVYVTHRPLAPFCETPRLMAMPVFLEKIDKRLREVTEIRHQIRAEALERDLS